ncbi:hypothetical protein BaRGS_00012310 [Batillaria attramentaria]|uniref:Uncharacterized protein n=1 Tax=Batillaria attramentaria TaxID=370345 RepID=A0ABD0LAI5_9CAEN
MVVCPAGWNLCVRMNHPPTRCTPTRHDATCAAAPELVPDNLHLLLVDTDLSRTTRSVYARDDRQPGCTRCTCFARDADSARGGGGAEQGPEQRPGKSEKQTQVPIHALFPAYGGRGTKRYNDHVIL